jgi:serine/threonine protein kinase
VAHKPLTFETAFETYRTSGVLGEGGAGRVYSAASNAGAEVALKSLLPERVSTERIRRFKNEIQFCQRNEHQNVLKVIDHGVIVIKDVKCPFYVMKRYPGTLKTLMPGLKLDDVLPHFAQILDGVDAAHKLNVWHRDLKPENVLWSGNDRRLVVADFGIAHFEEEEIYTAVETQLASRMANFLYSAPEQRTRGLPVDHRADIFALGLILNEMFTRAVPQGAGDKRIGDVSPAHGYLDALVEQMIQHEPKKRLASIDDIKAELIGRKQQFVALQKLDEAKRQVVPASQPPAFEPVKVISVDYDDGAVVLKLGRNPPPGWTDWFSHPSGSFSYILGYRPEQWTVHGNTAAIATHQQDVKHIQSVVNYGKEYVSEANQAYERLLYAQAQRRDKEKRAALEKKVADAELRKKILEGITL